MQYQDNLDMEVLRRYAVAMNARARAMQCDGEVSSIILQSIILESTGVCAWCGAGVINQSFEIDHIISLSQGGANRPDNLAITCVRCNRRKAEKHPARFAAELYAESGHKTPLIARIMSKYDVEHLAQKHMFVDEADEDDHPASTSTDNPIVPPYQW